MNIVVAQPPNIEEIRKVFTFTRRVIFAYGDTIYNPDNIRIDRPMLIHEEVHEDQQKEMGVKEWWVKYLSDPAFRVEQEKPAYRAQYRAAATIIKDRNKHFEYGRKLAEALSGDTYGHCISYADALSFITGRS